ncbi:MAG TPA: glycosyltransferase family 39 protein [Acidiphilium sp.]|nr:glycosyltransferase family 39 protein [Acidiphilium sp.]HQU24658.1 glycosyltransferase family 39 protein [Acidiphilium sp.]
MLGYHRHGTGIKRATLHLRRILDPKPVLAHPGPMNNAPPARLAIWIIVLATCFRLIVAFGMGLGIDESYMVAASHRFALSYFDHPFVSWWLELAIRRVTGAQTPLIVRLPFILVFAGTSFLMYCLTDRLYGARAALWAVIALTVSPVFSLAFGTWVLPDGPLDFFLLAAVLAMAKALGIARPDSGAQPDPKFWLVAGLCIGLAMDSKYNAALNLLGALLFLVLDPAARRTLATWRPWAACLFALALFSPVLIWNLTHHFASFDYQGGRAVGFGLYPLRPFIVWAGEALFVLPWIFMPMIVLMIGGLRRSADRRARFLATLAVIPVTLFSVVALWSSRKILYHWAAPGYLMLFPVLGAWIAGLADRRRQMAKRLAILSAGLLGAAVLFIAAELNIGIIPGFNRLFPFGHSPDIQAVDWTSVRATLMRRGLLDQPHFAIAATRWFNAGKIGYALGPAVKVTVFDSDPHEFAFTVPPRSLIGDNILIVGTDGTTKALQAQYAPLFRSLTIGKPIIIRHHGTPLLRLPVLYGQDLRRWPQPARP